MWRGRACQLRGLTEKKQHTAVTVSVTVLLSCEMGILLVQNLQQPLTRRVSDLWPEANTLPADLSQSERAAVDERCILLDEFWRPGHRQEDGIYRGYVSVMRWRMGSGQSARQCTVVRRVPSG